MATDLSEDSSDSDESIHIMDAKEANDALPYPGLSTTTYKDKDG